MAAPTSTTLATPMMMPRRVRKLRSLCARMESSARETAVVRLYERFIGAYYYHGIGWAVWVCGATVTKQSTPACIYSQLARNAKSSGRGGSAMKRRHHILVAEDNPADLLLVREALSTHGIDFDLTHFENGQEALAYLDAFDDDETQTCPEVALLDLNLPRTNGTELLQRLRQSRRCGHIPVVVLTGSEAPQHQKAASLLGASSYFRKPIDLSDFLQLGL